MNDSVPARLQKIPGKDPTKAFKPCDIFLPDNRYHRQSFCETPANAGNGVVGELLYLWEWVGGKHEKQRHLK